MDLRVIELTDEELTLEIAGEDHTFMNVLKGTLLESEDVEAATYDVNPEQSGGQTEPVLTVKTGGGVDPLDAVEEAAANLQEKTETLSAEFESASA